MVEIFYDRGKKELVLSSYLFFSKTGKVWSRLESNFLHIIFATSCSLPLNYLQIQIQMQKMNF